MASLTTSPTHHLVRDVLLLRDAALLLTLDLDKLDRVDLHRLRTSVIPLPSWLGSKYALPEASGQSSPSMLSHRAANVVGARLALL